jgi:ATP-dependent Lon protease
VVDSPIIKEALGNMKIDNILRESIIKPGVAIGMAWSPVGG